MFRFFKIDTLQIVLVIPLLNTKSPKKQIKNYCINRYNWVYKQLLITKKKKSVKKNNKIIFF